jgi:hypothetical protein
MDRCGRVVLAAASPLFIGGFWGSNKVMASAVLVGAGWIHIARIVRPQLRTQ